IRRKASMDQGGAARQRRRRAYLNCSSHSGFCSFHASYLQSSWNDEDGSMYMVPHTSTGGQGSHPGAWIRFMVFFLDLPILAPLEDRRVVGKGLGSCLGGYISYSFIWTKLMVCSPPFIENVPSKVQRQKY
ncbi:hypothetical protein SUGI_0812420, partial [Cryptomeria japonica]